VSVTLLYTGNHYEVIYPRPPENWSQQASQNESWLEFKSTDSDVLKLSLTAAYEWERF
jgi:hypothetical protein